MPMPRKPLAARTRIANLQSVPLEPALKKQKIVDSAIQVPPSNKENAFMSW